MSAQVAGLDILTLHELCIWIAQYHSLFYTLWDPSQSGRAHPFHTRGHRSILKVQEYSQIVHIVLLGKC